jgi:hypothetical protein
MYLDVGVSFEQEEIKIVKELQSDAKVMIKVCVFESHKHCSATMNCKEFVNPHFDQTLSFYRIFDNDTPPFAQCKVDLVYLMQEYIWDSTSEMVVSFINKVIQQSLDIQRVLVQFVIVYLDKRQELAGKYVVHLVAGIVTTNIIVV